MLRTALLLTITIIIAAAFSCDKDPSVLKMGSLPNKVKSSTAAGVRVQSNQPVSEAVKTKIDAGISKAFATAEAEPNNYSGFKRHDTYTVWLMPRSSKCTQAGFLIDASGTEYEGSYWDKDPSPNRCLICAAGMMLTHNFQPGMILVDDAATVENAARFEAEHNILWEVDMLRFAATQFHQEGQGHPILGDGPPSKAATLTAPVAFSGSGISVRKGDAFCVLVTD